MGRSGQDHRSSPVTTRGLSTCAASTRAPLTRADS